MTETDTDYHVDGTWEPNGGENAVIIQPAEHAEAPIVEVQASAEGPTIQRYVETDSYSDEHLQEYGDAIQGNKVGGAPAFIQYDEYPDREGGWHMLLQLDSCAVPFHLNFGGRRNWPRIY